MLSSCISRRDSWAKKLGSVAISWVVIASKGLTSVALHQKDGQQWCQHPKLRPHYVLLLLLCLGGSLYTLPAQRAVCPRDVRFVSNTHTGWHLNTTYPMCHINIRLNQEIPCGCMRCSNSLPSYCKLLACRTMAFDMQNKNANFNSLWHVRAGTLCHTYDTKWPSGA